MIGTTTHNWQLYLVVAVFAIMVNLVLSLWSSYTQSRGDHSGVNDMVQDSRGRRLTPREQMNLLFLAIINAFCEEVASRGFWRAEFQKHLSVNAANVVQSIIFGLWHYHGIPSGWTGVALTTVYGLFMGGLQDYSGGLLLPIMAHSIADYFIFAVIARRK
jgi:membrane protease YdiL (CAAX protease family)